MSRRVETIDGHAIVTYYAGKAHGVRAELLPACSVVRSILPSGDPLTRDQALDDLAAQLEQLRLEVLAFKEDR